jgi:hypothetical protein
MNEEDNEDIKFKQNLIKEAIIDKNYDKNSFFNFCMTRKPNTDDLRNWELEELQKVINDFINFENEKNQKISNEEEILKKTEEEAQNINLNMEQIRKQKTKEIKTSSSTSSYLHEIKCQILEKSILNDKKIKIICQNPKAVETGFFYPNYITYEIITEITENLKWTIRRRYSDFDWLRNTLVNFFPRLFVPPLPNKKMGSRRFELDFVEKRMLFLNLFLNNVIQNETFLASEPLVAFLSIVDRGHFEAKMKELSSHITSNYINDIKTLSGKIIISSDDDNNEKYYANISNYFKLQFQLLERLNHKMNSFYNKIKEALISLDDVQKDFDLLYLLNNRVQMKDEISKSYEQFGIFFKNWKRMLYNQNEIIKKNIKYFFKYVKMEGTAYCELIDKRDELQKKYSYEKNNLQIKKEKLWATMDISKWEITEDMEKIDRVLLLRDKLYACAKMCTVETKSLENLRKQLGYANRTNIEELKKMLEKYSHSFLVNIKEFADQLYPTLNDGLNIWTTIGSFAEVN